MSSSKSDVEELKSMQREAAELRAERKSRRTTAKSSVRKKSGTVEDEKLKKPPAQDPVGEEQAPEGDMFLKESAAHLESAVREIEEAAREHPALALLAAFITGIVVGQLFSRR